MPNYYRGTMRSLSFSGWYLTLKNALGVKHNLKYKEIVPTCRCNNGTHRNKEKCCRNPLYTLHVVENCALAER